MFMIMKNMTFSHNKIIPCPSQMSNYLRKFEKRRKFEKKYCRGSETV